MSPLTKVLIGLAAAALSLCLCGGIVAVINGSGPSAPDSRAADAARRLRGRGRLRLLRQLHRRP
ncbi:hypothetical protein AB0M54_20905 [Actinoplanes sp. NPDC051470]|uniref:hypothetical protein n=1 Tax=Actinoplanes sp. NPDC051470 TaxID=3157224 RepID=UPI003413292B